MKRIVSVLLVSLFLSCNKSNEPQDLPEAIQTIISNSEPGCVCLPYINKYKWKGAIVYMHGFRGPACSWTPAYYNMNGEPIVMATDYTFDKFLDESIFIQEVWKCE